MTQEEQDFLLFAKRLRRDKEETANATTRETMEEAFQAMKLRGVNPTTDVIEGLIDIFGYQVISFLPLQSKKDINILNYLAQTENADKFVLRGEDMIEFQSSYLGEKSVCVVGDVICTEASAVQIQDALKDYSSVQNLHASDFRKRESGESVSKDLYSVIYQQMKNEVQSLTSEEVEQGYEKQIQNTLNMLSEKKLQAMDEIASQNHFYSVASGYAKYLSTYAKQKASGQEVEPLLITLENKNAPLVFQCLEFDEFVSSEVDDFVEEAKEDSEVQGGQKETVGEIYSHVEAISKELEMKMKGKCNMCTLKEEDVETVKKIVLQTMLVAAEKEKLIANFFSTKNSLLEAIENAEEENMQ